MIGDKSETISFETNKSLNLTEQSENENEDNMDEEPIQFNSKIDSDIGEESDDNDIFKSKSRNRKKAIFSDDEESDEENKVAFITSKPDSVDDEFHSVRNRINSTYFSDSEDDKHSHESLEKKTIANIKYRPDIFDTEETDDEEDPSRNYASPNNENTQHEDSDMEEMENEDIDPKVKKKNEKKPSLKKRKEELQEIHSTTQKMVRESEIVLPYHKPRQRTLMEFLSRKKNVPQVDKSSARKSSLIMSMKNIKHLKEIEERKKDIDKFYKDDDEEEDKMKETENEYNAANDIDASENSITSVCGGETLMDLQDTDKTNPFNEEGTREQEQKEGNKEGQMVEMKNDDQKENIKEKKTHKNESKDEEELPVIDELSLKHLDLIAIKNCESNENCNTMEELPFLTDNDFSKEERKASSKKVVEDDIEVRQENPILFSDDSEDEFRLHLDTEDFDDDVSMKTEDLSKSSNKSSRSTNDPKSRNQRLSSLASKFPQLNFRNLTGITPRLSLGEGAFVDLEDPTPREETGVDALLNRFIEHSKKVKSPKKPKHVLLGVVSKEVSSNGEEKLVHSNVTFKLEGESEDMSKSDTPGARLTLLRNSLKVKMLEEREKARLRREKEKEFLDSEKVIQDYHDDGLPDEEAELTDQSETDHETESEPEENDVIITDKKRKKNKYLDEEADVDDDDEDDNGDLDNINEGDDGLADDDGLSEAETIAEDEEEIEEKNDDEVSTQKRKSVARIIDDEDEEEVEGCTVAYQRSSSETEDFKLCLEDTKETKELQEGSSSKEETGFSVRSIFRANTEELFSSQAGEESTVNSKNELVTSTNMASADQSFEMTGSVIPAAQHSGESQKLRNKSNLDVSVTDTPTTSLTPFSKLRTTTPDILTRENSDKVECQSALNFLLTPLKATQGTSFAEESVKRTLLLETPSKSTENIPATNTDMLGLCSGTFTAGTSAKSSTENNMDDLIGLCSGNFDLQKIEAQPAESLNKSSVGFPSYADTVALSSVVQMVYSEVTDVDRRQEEEFHFSDEENSKRERARSKKRKKRKRIVNMDLSSDEEEGEEENTFADDEEDKENAWTSDGEELMEYDENEEPIREKFGGFKDSVRGGIKIDYLDKEAELSGSEEGSDDEEEPDEDNDFMEREEGDLEKFDNEELRNQVGRAHLKSLIDSDKRELKLLQELYLEDGDLHGEGRQRKFRWKNIDNQDDGPNQQSEDEEKEEDVEEEADWRKQRFEREKYLTEKNGEQEEVHPSSLNEEITPTLQRSSSLKLVKNLSIKRVSSSTPLNSTPLQEAPLLMQNSLKKRGSFLSRDANTLQKLASFTKDHDNVTVGGARQTGNFVFQTLTEEEVKRSKEVEAKKSGRVGKQPEKKRLRIERSFFSMEETVQSASVFKHL